MPEAARRFDPNVADDLASLLVELSNNKETRAVVGKAIKKLKPDSHHAKAFADVDMDEKLQSFRDEQEAKELKRMQDAAVARQQAQRDRLLSGDESGRKYSEDDVKKIESLMQDKGISDYDIGRIVYSSTLPPENTLPTPVPPNLQGEKWTIPHFAEYVDDPSQAARNAASTVITEFMRKR